MKNQKYDTKSEEKILSLQLKRLDYRETLVLII